MALEFAANNQELQDTDGENYINGLSAITASVWVKSDLTGTDKGFVFGIASPNGTDQYIAMRYDAGGAVGGGSNLLKMGLQLSGTQHNRETSSSTQTTNWQHCVFKWTSGSVMRIFLDGVEDTFTGGISGTGAGTISGCTTLMIGKGAKDGSGGGWDGQVDDFRLYNRALSDNEILTLYSTQGSDRIVNGLLVRYAFRDFAVGTTLATTTDAVRDWGNTATRHATRTGTNGPVYRESILRLTGTTK